MATSLLKGARWRGSTLISAAARRRPAPPHTRCLSTSPPKANVTNSTLLRGIVAGMGLSLATALVAYRAGVITLSGEPEETGNSGATAFNTKYGSREDVQKAIAELRAAFADTQAVSTDADALQTYGSSPNSYHPTSPHSVVVHVLSTEDVVKVVNIARKYRVPIVAYAGATSLEGHFSGVRRTFLDDADSVILTLQ